MDDRDQRGANSRLRSAARGALIGACLALLACAPDAEQGRLSGRALGASDYQALGDPRVDVPAFAAALGGLGVTFTRVWLMDAWATGTGQTGTYQGVLPAVRQTDGRWDLFAWNPAYFARLRLFADEMNQHGIMPVFTLLELYSWSESKQGLLWVPDQSRGMFRANVNGIRWGLPDGPTFAALPDRWLQTFACRVVETLAGSKYAIEIGNEMPDKPMHDRIAEQLRGQCGYTGEIFVSREHDTPDVYREMDIGGRYDRLSVHGKENLGYLDVEHPGGPVPTFRALYESGADLSRVILSSDGARKTTNVEGAYDYAALEDVARDILRRGGSYEHQLAIKLRRFRDGRYDLSDLRFDAAFLRGLAEAR